MNRRERIEAGFMLSSYLDTLGFKNGSWEFNYNAKLDSIDKVNKIMMTMINEFLILGGPSDIDITGWNASDDTIMTIATAKGALTNDYKNMYIKVLPLLEESKRASGRVLLSSINCLKRNQKIKVDRNMGGNGAAMRTFPIGIKYNDEDKIIKESIMVSCLTHNYYIGFLGGVVSALFSSYALKGIKPWLWIEKLLKLYDDKVLYRYHNNDEEIDDFIKYWKRYNEIKLPNIINKMYDKNFIFSNKKLEFLLSFNPSDNIQYHVNRNETLIDKKMMWNIIGITGIDACIFAYDCLLMSIIIPNGTKNLNDLKTVNYSWSSFMMNITLHPGDSDTTGCIGGFWYGLLVGYHGIDRKKMLQLEFYDDLLEISKKFT